MRARVGLVGEELLEALAGAVNADRDCVGRAPHKSSGLGVAEAVPGDQAQRLGLAVRERRDRVAHDHGSVGITGVGRLGQGACAETAAACRGAPRLRNAPPRHPEHPEPILRCWRKVIDPAPDDGEDLRDDVSHVSGLRHAPDDVRGDRGMQLDVELHESLLAITRRAVDSTHTAYMAGRTPNLSSLTSNNPEARRPGSEPDCDLGAIACVEVNLSAMSDAELLAGSAAEPELFGAVFDRHYDRIALYLRRRLDSTVADELAAETFLQAFRARARYDRSRENVCGWLFGIATRLVARHHRAETRRWRAYARAAARGYEEADIDAAHARVDAGAMTVALADSLARLRGPERDVLLLYAWAEMSYEELAMTLEIPIGTVRSRLSRARDHLRGSLDAAQQAPLVPRPGGETR